MKTIQLIKTAGGFDMQFLSGVSYPLPQKNGFFIADSACGDGKTTMTNNIAEKMYPSGILIIVQTTESADTLYDTMCKSIPKEKICILHSQEKAETYMVEHRENPISIWKYEVLIITAVRIQQYPIELFIKFGVTGNKFRSYILIDEIISFFPEQPINPQKFLPDISYITATRGSKKGRLVKEIKSGSKTMFQLLYKDYTFMEAGVRANSIHRDHFKNPLSKYRLTEMLKYIASSGHLKTPTLDVDILSTNSTVILFDGTADVLFPEDKRLLSLGKSQPKYSSDIAFEQFHLPFRRRNGADWDINELEILGDDLFKWIADMTKSEKILILTWKDIDRKIINKVAADDSEVKETYDFPDILSRLLDKRGADKVKYGVIYRGSGLEKGCNAFKDCQKIIFLGEWFISDDVTPKLNSIFKGKSTMKDYKKSLLIQSICRLQIRQHTGKPIKVLFSDDMDYNLMNEVQEYFRANSSPSCKIDGVKEPIPKLGRYEKNHLFDIAVLGNKYPQLASAFISRSTLTIDISKSDLFNLLPKDKKSIDRYRYLTDYLLSHGITINIK